MRKGIIGNREFVEWKANLLCISLSASAPWRMWGNTTSISCSAESGESLPVQRIQSNWEILKNWLFQKHYTQCMMWIVTQQRFQGAKFSPLMHASLYRWRAAARIHVLLSFFKLATCHCHAPYNAFILLTTMHRGLSYLVGLWLRNTKRFTAMLWK